MRNFSEALGGLECILVLDGAGWHKSKELQVPENVEIVYLPPYCPELNPVERLWLYIKQNILRNKIYETIEDLEEAVCSFISALHKDTILSICYN